MGNRTAHPTRGPIDARRRLTPRDYAADPHGFGERPGLEFRTPPDGDPVSAQIAELIHGVVVALRHQPANISGAALGRRFGFSRQTWSSVTRGQRWPGHTVLAAMVAALRDASAQHGHHP